MRAFPIRAGIAAVLLAACPAAAQTTDATLVAEVVTGGGAPLAGATVTVRNASTGFIARGRTSADGRVTFRQLPLGGRTRWAPNGSAGLPSCARDTSSGSAPGSRCRSCSPSARWSFLGSSPMQRYMTTPSTGDSRR